MPDPIPSVLIVEDNPGLARVLTYKFKSCGFEPITCSNGDDAWRSFCRHDVAAVVTDHEMPMMSGLELIERIRQVDSVTPCFLVTGRQLELSRDPRIMKLRISDVLGKPFSPGTLIHAVSQSLQSARSIAVDSVHASASAQVESPSPSVTGTGA